MTKNSARRLGCVAAHGTEEAIRNHPFFREMDWEALEGRRVKPPFKPKIVSSTDLYSYPDKQLLELSDSGRYNTLIAGGLS